MIEHDRDSVRLQGDALSEVWWQGRQWAVTAYGLECRDGTYYIEKQRLMKDIHKQYGWIGHMADKNWIDLEDFTTGYLIALALHGFCLDEQTRMDVLGTYDKSIRKYSDVVVKRWPR